MIKDNQEQHTTPFSSLPDNLQILKLAGRWIGTVQYPFVLQAMKALYETDEYPLKNYKKWVFFNVLAVLLDHPNSFFLGKNPHDGERATTTDSNSARGLGVHSQFGNCIVPNNCDLTTTALLLTWAFTSGSAGYWNEFTAADMLGDHRRQFARIIALGFDPHRIAQFHATLMVHFDELDKHMHKLGFDKPLFYEYIGGAEVDDTSAMGFFDGVCEQILKDDYEAHETVIPRYVRKTYAQLLSVYQAIGIPFTLTKTGEVGVYLCHYKYEGLDMTGVIDQREHFCQLDDTHQFWGIMMPRVHRESGSIYPILEHLFREDGVVYAR